MTFILFFIAIILGNIKKKSKIVTLYIASVMFFLAAFRTQSSDLNAYKHEYLFYYTDEIGITRYIGYKIWLTFFNLLNINFEYYMVLFYIIVVCLLIFGIRLMTENVNLVLSIYLIFSYGIDVIQMKTCMANALSFLGVVLLLRALSGEIKQRKKNICIILFFILELLGSSFHFASIVYFLAGLLIVLVKNIKNLKRYILFGLVILVPAIYLGGAGVVLKFAGNHGLVGKDISYLSAYTVVNTRFGFVIPIIWVSFMLLFSLNALNRQIFSDNYVEYNSSKYDITFFTKSFMLTSILTIPLFFLYIYFSRVLRVYMILMYIIFANQGKSMINIKIKIYDLGFYASIFIAYWMEILHDTGTLASILIYNKFL